MGKVRPNKSQEVEDAMDQPGWRSALSGMTKAEVLAARAAFRKRIQSVNDQVKAWRQEQNDE